MARKSIGKNVVSLDVLSSITSLLTPEQNEELRSCTIVQHYKKNEEIYQDGDVPQMMYCLVNGKVKVYKEGIGGRTQIIRVVRPVELFGYRAFFANQNYVTSAAAFEPTEIYQIPLTLVKRWMTENIKLAFFFISLLSVELGNSDQRTVSLTQKHIRGRLAEALLFLKECYGLEADGATLSIYLSREDLANMSNMTQSNAIRTLSAFAAEKLIAIDGKKIKLIDFEMLEHISRMGY